MRTHITRPGRTSAEAARKRRKHERAVEDANDPKIRLRRLWSWVLAELANRPDHTGHAIQQVTELAEDLNERSIR